MTMRPWREQRAAKLLEEAARLEVPPPPPLEALAGSPSAKALAAKAAFKTKLVVVALVGAGLLVTTLLRRPQVDVPIGESPGPVAPRPALAQTAPTVPEEVVVQAPPERKPPTKRLEVARAAKPVLVAEAAPTDPVEPAPPPSSTLGEEAALLASALRALRQDADAARAVELLSVYRERFPAGILRPEALLAHAQAERALRHPEAALALLDEVGPEVNRKLLGEVDLTRGELLVELGRCEEADLAFARALEAGVRDALAERVFTGRARCAAQRQAR